MLTYFTLFSSAFLAATLIPAQSEAVLAYSLTQNPDFWFWLIAVASLGNISGSCVNWVMGRGIRRAEKTKWFATPAAHLAKAQGVYDRFGHFALLASWVPIIGDPITLVAGIMREPFWRFLLWVSLAKTIRYCIIAAGVFTVL